MPLATASDLSVNLGLFRAIRATNHYLRSSKIDGKLMVERIGNEIVEDRSKQNTGRASGTQNRKREA